MILKPLSVLNIPWNFPFQSSFLKHQILFLIKQSSKRLFFRIILHQSNYLANIEVTSLLYRVCKNIWGSSPHTALPERVKVYLISLIKYPTLRLLQSLPAVKLLHHFPLHCWYYNSICIPLPVFPQFFPFILSKTMQQFMPAFDFIDLQQTLSNYGQLNVDL